jgi:hypothetical protein
MAIDSCNPCPQSIHPKLRGDDRGVKGDDKEGQVVIKTSLAKGFRTLSFLWEVALKVK